MVYTHAVKDLRNPAKSPLDALGMQLKAGGVPGQARG